MADKVTLTVFREANQLGIIGVGILGLTACVIVGVVASPVLGGLGALTCVMVCGALYVNGQATIVVTDDHVLELRTASGIRRMEGPVSLMEQLEPTSTPMRCRLRLVVLSEKDASQSFCVLGVPRDASALPEKLLAAADVQLSAPPLPVWVVQKGWVTVLRKALREREGA